MESIAYIYTIILQTLNNDITPEAALEKIRVFLSH